MALFLVIACRLCGELDISSDEPIEYLSDSGELIARGTVRISSDNFAIEADEIRFQKNSLTLSANGNVKIDADGDYVIADEVVYEIPRKAIHAKRGKAKIGSRYFRIETLDASSQTITGTDGSVFFYNPDRVLMPHLSVKWFELSNFDTLKIKKATGKVGAVPLFCMENASIKFSDHPLHFSQNIGINRSNGLHLQNDFSVGTGGGTKIGGLFDAYARRGVLIGPFIGIRKKSESGSIFSEARFGFIKDVASKKIRGTDVRGKQIAKDRHFLEFACKCRRWNSVDITSNVQWLSDSEVERDFRKSLYRKTQRADSFLEISHSGENAILSAFGRLEPNSFFETVQRLPEFRFDRLPTQFFDTPLMSSAHIALSRLHGRDKRTMARSSSCRSDAYFGMSLPIGDGTCFSMRPLFGMRAIAYGHSGGGQSHGKLMEQCGIDIGFKFTGRSDYANDAFGIDGLKHTINPTLQYRLIPSGNESGKIPQLDTPTFNTELPPIDIDDMRSVDIIRRQNMLRIGVQNNLYTRSNGYIPKKLARFDIFQDVHFSRSYDDSIDAMRKKFSDTFFVIGLYPAEWLSIDACCRVDIAKLHMRELKTSVTLKDADFWKLQFFSNHLKFNRKITDQLGARFTFNLSSRTSLSVEEKYDAVAKKFFEQRFSFATVVKNSWLLDVGISVRSNVKREDKFQFNWHIRLPDF